MERETVPTAFFFFCSDLLSLFSTPYIIIECVCSSVRPNDSFTSFSLPAIFSTFSCQATTTEYYYNEATGPL